MSTSRITQQTFTTTETGDTVNIIGSPLSRFSLQVSPTGNVTAWTVILEGSLDDINYKEISTHTKTLIGAGVVLPSDPLPVCYYRLRCSALTLGAGTNIIATVLGIE